MVVRYHGPLCHAAEPAGALGVSPSTTPRYLDRLTDARTLRQPPRWHADLGKRRVKSPKIYVRDSGLERVAVTHPGAKRHPFCDSAEAVPLEALATPGTFFDGKSPAA